MVPWSWPCLLLSPSPLPAHHAYCRGVLNYNPGDWPLNWVIVLIVFSSILNLSLWHSFITEPIVFTIFSIFLMLQHIWPHCPGRDCPSQGSPVCGDSKGLDWECASPMQSPIQSPDLQRALLPRSHTPSQHSHCPKSSQWQVPGTWGQSLCPKIGWNFWN